MKKSIYAALIGMGTIAAALTMAAVMWFYYTGVRSEAELHLRQVTQILAEGMDQNADSQEWLKNTIGDLEGSIRVTWIAPDGKVRLESSYQRDQMENHLERQEVKDALSKGEGASRRESGTLERESSYYAYRLSDGSVLRGAVDRGSWLAIIQRTIPGVLGVMVIMLVLCSFVAGRLTNMLLQPIKAAGEAVESLIAGKPVPLTLGVPEIDPILARTREQQEHISRYIAELREERNRTRRMMNSLNEGIVLLDKEQTILDYNLATEKIFRLPMDCRGRGASAIETGSDWLETIRSAADGGKASMMLERDGRIYSVLVQRMRPANETYNLLMVVRDVTESYLAERHRREFSANVSHELNTPLTSIRGYAELLQNGMYSGADEVRNFSRRMVAESDRLLGLIQNIMRLSKIEESPQPAQWQPVSLHHIAKQVTELLELQSEEKGIRLQVHGDTGYIYGDERLLFELVLNLADNAVKYNRSGGSVDLGITETPDEVQLNVRDTGMGIPEEQQQYIFERFYRVEQSRSKQTGGSGLGLAIVKHIVQLHGGRVELKSVPKEGTEITVYFPKEDRDRTPPNSLPQ